MKKHFYKDLIMSEEEEQFQLRNACGICEKLIDNDDGKVGDHCHVTRKFRGAAHWSCKMYGIFLNKNLVFTGSMQFMNSSLEKLVKNLSDNYFKYLTEEFGSKNLELLKQKDAYPYECMDSFKRFGEEKLPDKECFYNSLKDGTTNDNSKRLDSHITYKDYLMCKKLQNEFNM